MSSIYGTKAVLLGPRRSVSPGLALKGRSGNQNFCSLLWPNGLEEEEEEGLFSLFGFFHAAEKKKVVGNSLRRVAAEQELYLHGIWSMALAMS
jgi:hypothetical protein